MDLQNQLFAHLPLPTQAYTSKFVIVTGSNTGLGLEAARYIAKLDPERLILAVRDVAKGEAAKNCILSSAPTCKASNIVVWPLDLADPDSIVAFSERVDKELDRLDTAVLNAGVALWNFIRAPKTGSEMTIAVNVTGTFLLLLLLLPKMKETAKSTQSSPVLTVVSSSVHEWPIFKEKNASNGSILDALDDEQNAEMWERYQVSKLLEILCVREIARRTSGEIGNQDSYPVTINTITPGYCVSHLRRNASFLVRIIAWLMELLIGRTTEQGARTLVHATTCGKETHGCYLSSCKVEEPSVFVQSDEGKDIGRRIWEEVCQRCEKIKPGVSNNLLE